MKLGFPWTKKFYIILWQISLSLEAKKFKPGREYPHPNKCYGTVQCLSPVGVSC